VGVSALGRDGAVPSFSNRDAVYNDIAAPGQDIFSTMPRSLTRAHPTCTDQGYSDCGPDEFRHAAGTSFAAPQVTAAAALLFALKPTLQADQVENILERSTTDVNAANGCKSCPLQRDSLSGWGRLDVSKAIAALDGVVPSPDRYEPNDDAGSSAVKLTAAVKSVKATIDFWDDNIDVYRVHLNAHAKLFARLTGKGTVKLALWAPGTQHVEGLDVDTKSRLTQGTNSGAQVRLSYRAGRAGVYYLEAKLVSRPRDPASYSLALARRTR
jgi:hypothetical protein